MAKNAEPQESVDAWPERPAEKSVRFEAHPEMDGETMVAIKRKYTNADEVYKRLEHYFAENPFAMGDRVPPERDLADALKVNRTTLRSAMHRMVKEGVLERHVGRGTFFKASPSSILENYRQISMDCSPAELLELRMLVEPQVAALAVAHATGEQLQQMHHYTASLIEAVAEDQLTQDLRLQSMLAECLRNRLLLQITELISQVRRRFDTHAQGGDRAGLAFPDQESWRRHQQAICRAVLQRNAKAAAQAIDEKLAALHSQFTAIPRGEGR